MYLRAPSPPTLVDRTWPTWLSDGNGGGDAEDELQNWSSLIGIVTAICGNILIALALNVQRYAHIRLHRRRIQIRERARQALKNTAAASQGQGGGGSGRYGTAATSNGNSNESSNGIPNGGIVARYSDDDSRDSSETDPLTQSFRSDDSADDVPKTKVASTYLKDPYWWLGQVLITVGEMGNFLAYGFAPASIVSPLGVVALVSNCVIAPIFFKEVFRQRDFWGVIIAIMGAVTVVLSAKTEETKLGPHEVWDAITTMEFEIYMGVSCALIALLMWLSPRYGNRTILIDLGLVGLFGGYTALATKGVSSMLSSTLLGAFTTPVTYVLLFILLFTAIMQVRYVNKALQRFDSTQVIPIQFVLFTLCVIIGSAVLYRDFERTTSEQAIKFAGGCLFTFFGVFLITSGRPRQDDEDEATLSDAEGIEETIGLAEQDRAAPPTPSHVRRAPTPARSRGSSRTSHVSFKDAINKPLPNLPEEGFPTSRVPPSQKPPIIVDEADEDHEDAPLLGNPWRDTDAPARPTLGSHTVSADTILSAAVSDGSLQPRSAQEHLLSTTPKTTIPTITSTTPPRISTSFSLADRPVTTPRASTSAAAGAGPGASSSSFSSARHLPPPASHVYSPSPFSSTLSAVVGDKLLAHIDGGGRDRESHSYSSSPTPGGGGGHPHLGAAARRGKPGLRGSLFVSFPEAQQQYDGVGEGRKRGESVVGAWEPASDGELVTTTNNNNGGSGGGGGGGLRGRARSLSQTLGLAGLFASTSARKAARVRREVDGGSGGGGESNSNNAGEGEGEEGFGGVLSRARTTGDPRGE
ncbi:hypothetical protein VTI74DRAFT_9000 [Chaetomium olivicolor]